MHPILLQIGPITLYTYGLFYALGIFAGSYIFHKKVVQYKVKIAPHELDNLLFIIVVGIIFGARLMYVMLDIKNYIQSPLKVFALWEGGMFYQGGLVGGILGGYIYVRYKKLPVLKLCDSAAPAIALGHSVGRIGCFFAGCCYGKVTTSPLHVIFTHPQTLAPRNTPLIPTQIYSFLLNFLLFIFLFFKKQHFEGENFSLYLVLSSLIRFYLEFLRGDWRGITVICGFTITHVISMLTFFVGIFLYIIWKRRSSLLL
jgi:phosphatidylglycerol:prolipoprotein diacylglycerol transferase